MAERPSAAASIYPHLKRAIVSTPEVPRRAPSSPLAMSMYPTLAKKSQPLTPEEIRQAWGDDFLARVGLRRRKG
jgi:hypothetical protein